MLSLKASTHLSRYSRSPGKQAVCDRHDEKRKDSCRQNPGENDDADHFSGFRPGPGGEDQGDGARGGGDAGHDNGTQSYIGGLKNGAMKGYLLLPELIGELDDQYPVFGRQTDQHDQTDLAIKIQGATGQVKPQQTTCHGQRNRQHDHKRINVALKLGGKD